MCQIFYEPLILHILHGQILVVDDDIDLLNIMQLMLIRSGFEVRSLNNGKAVMAILNKIAPIWSFSTLIWEMPMEGKFARTLNLWKAFNFYAFCFIPQKIAKRQISRIAMLMLS